MRSPFVGNVQKFFTLCPLATLLCASLLFSACAKKSTDSEKPAANVYSFETKKEQEAAVQQYSLTCNGPCAESQGALLAKHGLDLKTCSLSLVAPDIVLTNRHCLPKALSAGASCSGEVTIFFAKNEAQSVKTEVFQCKKILSSPAEYVSTNLAQRDFVFIQLEKSLSRKPLNILPTGVQDQEVLTALVATPIASTQIPSSRLESVSCTAHMHSTMDPSYTSAKTPIVIFKNCATVAGHSGAAMVDAQGNVKALAQASAVDDGSEVDESTLSGRHKIIARTGRYAMASNATCLDNAELRLSSRASGCDLTSPPYVFKPSALPVDEDAEMKFAAEKLAALNQSSEIVHFDVEPVTDAKKQGKITTEQTSFAQVPKCLQGSAKNPPWLQQFAKTKTGKTTYPASAEVSLTVLKIRYGVDLDDDARFALRRIETPENLVLTLPVQKIAEGNQAVFTVKAVRTSAKSQSSTNDPKTSSLKLPFCQP